MDKLAPSNRNHITGMFDIGEDLSMVEMLQLADNKSINKFMDILDRITEDTPTSAMVWNRLRVLTRNAFETAQKYALLPQISNQEERELRIALEFVTNWDILYSTIHNATNEVNVPTTIMEQDLLLLDYIQARQLFTLALNLVDRHCRMQLFRMTHPEEAINENIGFRAN